MGGTDEATHHPIEKARIGRRRHTLHVGFYYALHVRKAAEMLREHQTPRSCFGRIRRATFLSSRISHGLDQCPLACSPSIDDLPKLRRSLLGLPVLTPLLRSKNEKSPEPREPFVVLGQPQQYADELDVQAGGAASLVRKRVDGPSSSLRRRPTARGEANDDGGQRQRTACGQVDTPHPALIRSCHATTWLKPLGKPPCHPQDPSAYCERVAEERDYGRCARCQAQLVEAFAQSTVACGYCRTVQPNPRPIPLGHEVLVAGPHSMKLGRVVASTSPEDIHVRIGAEDGVHRLNDLVPVTHASSRFKPGALVYAKTGLGYVATTVVANDGHTCRVMHPERGFRSSFFDRDVPVGHVRAPVPAPARERTGRLAVWTKRMLGDSFSSTLFMVVHTSIMVVVLVSVACFVGAFVLSFFGKL